MLAFRETEVGDSQTRGLGYLAVLRRAQTIRSQNAGSNLTATRKWLSKNAEHARHQISQEEIWLVLFN